MIMVVDDEAAYREVLAKILTKAGYPVITAADGNEALRMFENSHVNLIISDVFMPNLNGYALAARIRAKDPNVHIILISGYLSQDTAKNLVGGSTEFIAKPVDSELMIATVQRLMSAVGSKRLSKISKASHFMSR
jgi:DNA-binding NtrC family response regulator